MKSGKAIGVVLALVASIYSSTAAPVQSADTAAAQVIDVSAKKYKFTPSVITLKKGVPVVFHLTSVDRTHGFNVPGFNVRTDVPKGKVTELKITPQKTGTFTFYCDVFCGDGHDDMNGKIVVTD